ncbi:uncharacterized protein LOC144911616 isoform X3 [Branchiostoma floridae x Branchiostoma belcheri]
MHGAVRTDTKTPPGEVQLSDVAAEITGRGEASVPTNLGDPHSHMRLQLAVGQRARRSRPGQPADRR